MKNYLLELTVFLTGGIVMALELCGSRILAPYVGVSIVVWTSLIGIVLGSLSIGYYVGGKLADKKASLKLLSFLILIASGSILFIIFLRNPILVFFQLFQIKILMSSVLSSILLFFVPNFLLGMVTPIATKLRIGSITKAGEIIGRLYALSTIGSIIGTFITGFYLILYFSVTQILVGIWVLLFILSLLLSGIYNIRRVLVLASILTLLILYGTQTNNRKIYESQYNHIEVFDVHDKNPLKDYRVLKLDSTWNSAMYLHSDELVFKFNEFFLLPKEINPNSKKILMVGGGGYTVPKAYLSKFSDVLVNVVEIDPVLTDIAKKEFNLKQNNRLKIFHEDGRQFLSSGLKQESHRYDAILIDAFSGFSVPFHLTTFEYIAMMKENLSEDGFIVINVISKKSGYGSEFFTSELLTYKKVFSHVYFYPVDTKRPDGLQNIILVATNKKYDRLTTDYKFEEYIENYDPKKQILTDDFAPVDQYIARNIR